MSAPPWKSGAAVRGLCGHYGKRTPDGSVGYCFGRYKFRSVPTKYGDVEEFTGGHIPLPGGTFCPGNAPATIVTPNGTPAVNGGSGDICRICHCEADLDVGPLISPCICSGSLRFVHQVCLQQWIKSSNAKCCELCKFQFVMNTKIKPFRKWEKLDMSRMERRKMLCSVSFHVIALTCVVWSLYVLIERTTEEMKEGNLDWPFWTKLVVVAIGFTGGCVFMYVQCKMYGQLLKRWRAYNRVIYVQNAPRSIKQQQQHSIVSNAALESTIAPSVADESVLTLPPPTAIFDVHQQHHLAAAPSNKLAST